MAMGHSAFGLIALALLSGSLAMLFFVILGGVTRTPPLDGTYFLQAETFGIEGARPVTQWTYFYVCGPGNYLCGPAEAAMGIGSAWSRPGFGAPFELVGEYGGGTTSHYYWYMWRFGWVFYMIALVFEVLTLFAGLVACCGRLGSAIAGLVGSIALLFLTIAVCLMTATFVKMRNAFQSVGRFAQVGSYAFGFSWGAWAALMIAVALFCLGARGRKTDHVRKARRTRSTRSHHRSVDVVGTKRVKEEYA